LTFFFENYIEVISFEREHVQFLDGWEIRFEDMEMIIAMEWRASKIGCFSTIRALKSECLFEFPNEVSKLSQIMYKV
jgi:hypothetical protein